jgi:hypothetical protein
VHRAGDISLSGVRRATGDIPLTSAVASGDPSFSYLFEVLFEICLVASTAFSCKQLFLKFYISFWYVLDRSERSHRSGSFNVPMWSLELASSWARLDVACGSHALAES